MYHKDLLLPAYDLLKNLFLHELFDGDIDKMNANKSIDFFPYISFEMPQTFRPNTAEGLEQYIFINLSGDCSTVEDAEDTHTIFDVEYELSYKPFDAVGQPFANCVDEIDRYIQDALACHGLSPRRLSLHLGAHRVNNEADLFNFYSDITTP